VGWAFLLQVVVGLWAGAVANAIWYYRFDKYKLRHLWTTWLEHYHWATILYILGFRLQTPLLVGVATMLLIDEAVGQTHKFALGSDHEVQSTLIEVLIIAVWALAELISRLAGSLLV